MKGRSYSITVRLPPSKKDKVCRINPTVCKCNWKFTSSNFCGLHNHVHFHVTKNQNLQAMKSKRKEKTIKFLHEHLAHLHTIPDGWTWCCRCKHKGGKGACPGSPLTDIPGRYRLYKRHTVIRICIAKDSLPVLLFLNKQKQKHTPPNIYWATLINTCEP